jgi:lipid-A-disaccharide synthase
VRYITLVNLLAAKDIFLPHHATPNELASIAREALFPEYITSVDRSREIAAHAIGWLTDQERRAQLARRLEALRDAVGQAGACSRAVDIIFAELDRRRLPLPRPHYSPGWTPAAEIAKQKPRQAA